MRLETFEFLNNGRYLMQLPNPGSNAAHIALLLGSTAAVVQRYVRLYNLYGSDYLANLHWGGRREQCALLTFEQEDQHLQKVAEKSLKGEILTAKAIRAEVELAVNGTVSDDYLWDLFKRHAWTKKAPCPKHPMQKAEDQEELKKNSLIFWQPALKVKKMNGR